MFDKLIDFLINQVNNILPFYIVYQYHKGCRYWCGKFVGVLEPGFYFKVPYLHTMHRESAVDTTLLLPPQSLSTVDDKHIVLRGCVGYKIEDMGKYFNNVYDTKSAISDNACLVLRQQCSLKYYGDIKDISIGVNLRRLLQKEVSNYGIKINFFGLVDIVESRSYRLFNENIKLES